MFLFVQGYRQKKHQKGMTSSFSCYIYSFLPGNRKKQILKRMVILMRKSRKTAPAAPACPVRSKSFREKLSDAVDMPLESLYNLAQMQVLGNREIVLEGCKGILEYDDNVIRVGTKTMEISFWGNQLTLKCLNTDTIIIEGNLERIEFIV